VEHIPCGRETRVVLLLAAIGAASLVATAQSRQLRLVSTAWPPFTNEGGRPRFALDLVEAATDRIGFSAKTTIVDASQFTTSLLSGPFDGSAAAWKDPERTRALVFSQPYLENRLILVARRGGDVSAGILAVLKGKRIAIVEGYSYGDDIQNAGPTFVRSRSEEDSVRLLLTNAVDYTLMDELVVQYIVDHYAEEARNKLAFGSRSLVTRPLHLAVRRDRPDAQTIVDRFNAQLRAMIADRTYHRLLHVAWIQADVDGDGVTEYVPASDQSGPAEPRRAYALFANQESPSPQSTTPPHRYYFGGNIYSDWASVPRTYKSGNSSPPDPGRSTASIFTFNWR
jgi:polar amino acid transport system substrate-binding protein